MQFIRHHIGVQEKNKLNINRLIVVQKKTFINTHESRRRKGKVHRCLIKWMGTCNLKIKNVRPPE